jgi:isochorismate pyruvate lyase
METPVKQPLDCKSIDEVRAEIDRIDKEIIGLLGKRFLYVKEVVKFKKPDKDSIYAKDRFNKVIEERSRWAKSYGLDATVIEQIYRILMNYFIEEELKIVNLKK